MGHSAADARRTPAFSGGAGEYDRPLRLLQTGSGAIRLPSRFHTHARRLRRRNRSAIAAGQLLREPRELGQGRLALCGATLTARERVRERDPAVASHTMESNLALIQELDPVRPRDTEQVRRSLRSQVLVLQYEPDIPPEPMIGASQQLPLEH
jgi:hypothetical protein